MSLRTRLPALLADAFAADDDRALVRRFAESHDEAAFAAVVARHARMVFGVCRRAVRDEHLAEDAFQAVFLVLAKNPARAAHADAVGGWLFGIARRVGMAARRREERYARRASSRQADVSSTSQVGLAPRRSPDFDDLLRVLDEELAALPEPYRAPLVACFLEERTQDEAARHLGWSLSTLRRRLDRGKELLRNRLSRRGATLAGGLFAGVLAPSARAAVPTRLLAATAPSAKPAPLAAALASEAAGGSVAWKLVLAALAVALTLGGAVSAFGGRGETDEPELGALTIPARQSDEKNWVAVKGRIVLPQNHDIATGRLVPWEMIKDAEFFGPQAYRDVLFDPESRGLINAVVWLRPDSDDKQAAFPADKIHPDLAAAKPVDRSIQTTRDGFSPRVTAARAGDQLVFSNPSPVVFNVRYRHAALADVPMGWEAGEFNVLLLPGKSHTTKPLPTLRAANAVSDTIHPWVQGYVWAFDHPYFAVTDEKGNFEIKHAPPGKWRLVVWHEKAGYRNGAKGRLGEAIEVGPGIEMKPLALESEAWGEK